MEEIRGDMRAEFEQLLRMQRVFPLSEEGLAAAAAWVAATYQEDPERWASAPSILDCEPWTPPAAGAEGEG